MTTRIITAALFALALAPATALAGTVASDQDTAVQACQGFNEYGPTEVYTVVDDGLGDYLVWLTDVDGDLWACNANAYGDIYANVLVDYDLLDGEGQTMLHLAGGPSSRDPARLAERLCVATAEEQVKVIATAEDGFGDYLVWLRMSDETFIMCNASGTGELWAFEYVGFPINEAPAVATFEEPSVNAPTSSAPIRPGSPGQFG